MDPSSDVKYEWRSVKYTRIFQGFGVGRSNRPMEYEVQLSNRTGMPKTKAVSRGGDLVVREMANSSDTGGRQWETKIVFSVVQS